MRNGIRRFSSTVNSGSRCGCWKARPTWARRDRAEASGWPMGTSWSPARMLPDSQRSRPATQLSRVVLPTPEGPTTAHRAPASTSREKPSNTGCSAAGVGLVQVPHGQGQTGHFISSTSFQVQLEGGQGVAQGRVALLLGHQDAEVGEERRGAEVVQGQPAGVPQGRGQAVGVHGPVAEARLQAPSLARQEGPQEGLVEGHVVPGQDDGLAQVGEVLVQEHLQHGQRHRRVQRRGGVLHQVDAVHLQAAARDHVGLVPDEDLQAVDQLRPVAHHQPQAQQAVAAGVEPAGLGIQEEHRLGHGSIRSEGVDGVDAGGAAGGIARGPPRHQKGEHRHQHKVPGRGGGTGRR